MTHQFAKSLTKGLAVATIATAAGTIATAPAHAITIANYDFGSFTGNSTSYTTASTTTASNVTASSLSIGAGNLNLGDNGSTNYGNYVAPLSTTAGEAVANASYITFNVAPTGGRLLNLNSLSVKARDSDAPASASIFLRSSLDGFANNIGAVQAVNATFPTFFTNTFSLSAPTYQNLAGTITFRLYTFDTQSPFRSYDIDDVLLDGTVTTPVPFPFAPLPGLALAWVIGRGRQFIKKQRSFALSSKA